MLKLKKSLSTMSKSILTPKLSIVIHAEEEFDWSKGFYRANTQVNHGQELIQIVNELISLDVKVTLAMDYAFVNSLQGQEVIANFKPQIAKQIEFAAHLHPWVNPPFYQENIETNNHDSFAGNLSKDEEYNKLKCLTEKIETQVGVRPISYLAGRYGIGENTQQILRHLGYKIDLSISAYSNFSHIEGPNFSHYTNQILRQDGLTFIPHTCSWLALNKKFEQRINLTPCYLEKVQQKPVNRLVAKLMRVKKHRLSPEGFSFSDLKRMTKAQLSIGQEVFLLSFHSPSVKLGGTSYVSSPEALCRFKSTLMDYVNWFNRLENSSSFLPSYYKDRESGYE